MRSNVPYNLRMPVRERRTIFREMAKSELRRGPLSAKQYRGLVAYAARIGIHPSESVDLVREAARDLGARVPTCTPRTSSPFSRPVSAGMWLALSIALIAAAVFHLFVR